MVKVNNKQRLLQLMEWFRQETDESNQWTVDDIISKFQIFYGEEYTPNKNSLKDDIENLIEANESGYSKRWGRSLYFVG